MTPMFWILLAAILAPAALGGWVAGSRGGIALLVGILLSLLTVLALLVLTDNAGDQPDIYPSTVFMIVFSEFMIAALVGSLLRERRLNAFQQEDF